jgi:hypothetical protein
MKKIMHGYLVDEMLAPHYETLENRTSPEQYAEELFGQLRRDFSASLQREREANTKRLESIAVSTAFRMNALEQEITTLKELVDEQRETIQLLWDAPANPGGQEMIRQAKESAAAYLVGGTHSSDRENGGLGIN